MNNMLTLKNFLEYTTMGAKVAIEMNQSVVVGTVEEHLEREDVNDLVLIDEIEPDGYTDANGISYLKIYTRDFFDNENNYLASNCSSGRILC